MGDFRFCYKSTTITHCSVAICLLIARVKMNSARLLAKAIRRPEAIKQFSTSAVKRHVDYSPPPLGYTCPWPVGNKNKMTLVWSLFFSSGFALPFVVVSYHLNRDRLGF